MTITRLALDDIVAHAREADPQECCGVLLGVGDRITVAVRARNVETSPTRFSLDPRDHIAARKQARAAHQEVLGFYHSHPRSAPQPSSSDIAEWSYPEALSVIVGREHERLLARAFTIGADAATEVSLEVECLE